MNGLEYIDEDLVTRCKQMFLMVYPEFTPVILGVSNDKKSLIARCEFPDGVFYFKVSEDSISRSFSSIDDAERS